MDELDYIKKLAGVTPFSGLKEYSINDGSNVSVTGTQKAQLMREHDIRPGTKEWFKLWFSRPYLTGEKPIGD